MSTDGTRGRGNAQTVAARGGATAGTTASSSSGGSRSWGMPIQPMRGGSGHRAAGGQKATNVERDVIVLVVDDEPVIRAFVARALAQDGFTTVTAGDGREALRLVAEDRVRPAVLVTDIEMPGMTGIELAARLLALRPAFRVVMMTGDAGRAVAARGHPSIVDAVLMKPMQIGELIEAVRSTSDRASVG